MVKKPTRTPEEKKKILNIVAEAVKNGEADYYISRYCGLHNVILCKKTFGVRLYASDFTDNLFIALFENLPD